VASKKYTPEEILMLQNHQVPPGRDAEAARKSMVRLGFKTPKKSIWNEQNVQKLIDLASQGMSATQIYDSKIFNTTRDGIRKKMAKLKILNSRTIYTTFLKGDLTSRLNGFLQDNSVSLSPKEMVKSWNKANELEYKLTIKKLRYHLEKLGLKKINDEMMEIREKEEIIKSEKSLPSIVNEKIRQLRSSFMSKRIELGCDIWTGEKLPQEYLDELLEFGDKYYIDTRRNGGSCQKIADMKV